MELGIMMSQSLIQLVLALGPCPLKELATSIISGVQARYVMCMYNTLFALIRPNKKICVFPVTNCPYA